MALSWLFSMLNAYYACGEREQARGNRRTAGSSLSPIRSLCLPLPICTSTIPMVSMSNTPVLLHSPGTAPFFYLFILVLKINKFVDS